MQRRAVTAFRRGTVPTLVNGPPTEARAVAVIEVSGWGADWGKTVQGTDGATEKGPVASAQAQTCLRCGTAEGDGQGRRGFGVQPLEPRLRICGQR